MLKSAENFVNMAIIFWSSINTYKRFIAKLRQKSLIVELKDPMILPLMELELPLNYLTS